MHAHRAILHRLPILHAQLSTKIVAMNLSKTAAGIVLKYAYGWSLIQGKQRSQLPIQDLLDILDELKAEYADVARYLWPLVEWQRFDMHLGSLARLRSIRLGMELGVRLVGQDIDLRDLGCIVLLTRDELKHILHIAEQDIANTKQRNGVCHSEENRRTIMRRAKSTWIKKNGCY